MSWTPSARISLSMRATIGIPEGDKFVVIGAHAEDELIADPHFLLEQTGEALRTRLDTEYVAIYTIDGSSYSLAISPPANEVPPRTTATKIGSRSTGR